MALVQCFSQTLIPSPLAKQASKQQQHLLQRAIASQVSSAATVAAENDGNSLS